MSNGKKTSKKLLEIDARLKELKRAFTYVNSDYYYRRTDQLEEEREKLKKQIDSNELAPDIQFIVTEYEEE